MSLSDILDEISGDLTDIEDKGISDAQLVSLPITGSVSKEEIFLFDEELPSIDRETLVSLYKKEDLLTLKKVVGDSTKVDKSLVLEAMAALPIVDKLTEAKLTTAPSAINKKILDDIIYEGTDQVPDKWITGVKGLYEEIVTRSEVIESLVAEVEGRYDDIANVIDYKNLKEESLYLGNIAGFEGFIKVIDAFKIFQDLINVNGNEWSIKGKELLDVLDDVKRYVRANARNISEFRDAAKLYLEGNPKLMNGEFNYVIQHIETVYSSMDGLNKIASIVKGEDCAMALIKLELEKLEK